MARGENGQQGANYYSSPEKNIVRENYDLPLIKLAAERKDGPLRYLGLPGTEALDLLSWGHLCEYVAAVEVLPKNFQTVKHLLRTQFGAIEHRAHLGDVDEVILTNRGKSKPPQFVSTTYRQGDGYIWDFDVIFLDYFGKFLPYDRGSSVVRNRANALRRLFAIDRQDARQPWLLMLTIESQLYGRRDREQMRQFLDDSRMQSDFATQKAIDFLLDDTVRKQDQAARLVHGTMSYIIAVAASNSDVRVLPRGTILYEGANGTPMLHFAYEITPSRLLSGPHSPLSLLTSPLLRVRADHSEPWFELTPTQPPGQTESTLRTTLQFLGDTQIVRII